MDPITGHEGPEVTMLLCDAAQAVEGKLYVLGGGWSQMVYNPDEPTDMAPAIKLSVPWDQANRPVNVRAALYDEDRRPMVLGDNPVELGGQLEVGRPPGMKHGTPLDAHFVLDFKGLFLQPGGYVWEFEVDDRVKARALFRVYG